MAKERANNGGGSAATFPKRRRLAKIILGAYLLIAGCFYFGIRLGRYAESFSAATYHHHGAALVRRSSNKCVNGPYILDQNSHLEGMGSTFQHRKYSLILAAAVNSSWIGSLHNRHSKVGANGESRNGAHVDGPNFAHSYFGLGDPNCSMEDLKAREAELEFVRFERPKDSKGEFFVATKGKYRFPSTKSLCRSVENGTTAPWMTSNTVIELKYKSKPRESYNYCLFNRRFRQRFARRQRERNVRTKGQDDLWIGVHFRWGDVAKWSSSIESPNKRAGGVGLSGYINEARFQLDKQRGQNKTITLHFFSEGDKAIFVKFREAFPDAEMHINGDWRESLDLMTQSDVLIGGQSGFFVLASHLCDGCTVVTASPTNKKFRASSVERNLTNYSPVIGFSSRLADDKSETDVEFLSSGDDGNATALAQPSFSTLTEEAESLPMLNASVANAESRGSVLPTINMRQAKRGNFGVHHLNRGKPKGRRRPVEMPCDVLRNTALPPNGRISYSFLACDDYRLGNQLPLIYMMWLLAGSAGVPLKWRCMSSHTGTILHSLYELHKSSFERPRLVNATTSTSTLHTICNTCTSNYPHTCGEQSFEQAADWIRDDLQQVTTAMVPEVVPVPDVAIHLRCGDLLKAKHRHYGFLPHSTYVRLIRKEYGLNDTDGTLSRKLNATIGIVTEPFGSANEPRFGPSCQTIVNDLVGTLKTAFPGSRVEVFNQREDGAIPKAWTRLAKAKRMSVCGPSTFALWPTMSARKAFIYNSTITPWITSLSQRWKSLEVYDSPLLNPHTGNDDESPPPLSDWDMKDILGWLRDN